MQKKKQPSKRMTIGEIKRRDKLTAEIYAILQKEAYNLLERFTKREDSLITRLNSMEQNGVPKNTLDDIHMKLSSILYNQRRLIKANEELLSFFRITKDFFKEEQPQTPQ